nr:hypothetical protein [Tanacetum cinerariifolium]GFA17789.1 hypothetical protein [Tanacetum cinerariifolium]GFA23477.1 hypothetical protein [Tanacetum cinerariifolium]
MLDNDGNMLSKL